MQKLTELQGELDHPTTRVKDVNKPILGTKRMKPSKKIPMTGTASMWATHSGPPAHLQRMYSKSPSGCLKSQLALNPIAKGTSKSSWTRRNYSTILFWCKNFLNPCVVLTRTLPGTCRKTPRQLFFLYVCYL